MPLYLGRFSYTPEAIKALISNPQDRSKAAAAAVESLGGKMIGFWFAFGEFDVPWRNDLVCGWNPIRNGEFGLGDQAGLGVELDESVIRAHPYVQNSFPSLWDKEWLTNFTQTAVD